MTQKGLSIVKKDNDVNLRAITTIPGLVAVKIYDQLRAYNIKIQMQKYGYRAVYGPISPSEEDYSGLLSH